MMPGHLSLGPGREFDHIRRLAAQLGDRAAVLGDDCALLPDAPGRVVLSTDTCIEGVHFRREWLSLEEVGWRAATGALSDLAAAAASCTGLLAAVTCPRSHAVDELSALMEGIGAAARAAGGLVLGGDLTAGPVWSACVTVVGRAERPMSRRGARPDDGLWVTGELGGARSALVHWEAGVTPPVTARAAFARPSARVRAGQWLAARGATAMIDLSDGLVGDAAHLAAASDVGIRVALERLPVHPGVADAARLTGVAAEALAAQGGEDYELLVTLPAGFPNEDRERFEHECRVRLTRIGEVRAEPGVSVELRGRPLELHGFDHFA